MISRSASSPNCRRPSSRSSVSGTQAANEMIERQAERFMTAGSSFGADEDELMYVHHTGGIVPEVWMPYQPTVEGFSRELRRLGRGDHRSRDIRRSSTRIIGDFRSYSDLIVREDGPSSARDRNAYTC